MSKITEPKNYKIALGTDDFKELVTEYDIFVDKTLFIQKIVDNSEKAMLITYPRRWGKTLNLNMLKIFFEPESQECLVQKEIKSDVDFINMKLDIQDNIKNKSWYSDFSLLQQKNSISLEQFINSSQCNRDIFLGSNSTLNIIGEQSKALKALRISTVNSGQYMQYQGKYPVIFISLKDVVGNSISEIQSKLKDIIKELYKQHRYINDSAKLYIDEKLDFQKYIDKNYQGITLENSLKFLSELLYKHYNQKVYILVDEYDKPVNTILEEYLGQEYDEKKEKLIKETMKFISQTICSSVSKTNPYLKKLILTGIFDTLQKESGSGCNNISTYGVSDIRFSTDFGFSYEEVEALVTKLAFDNHNEVMKNITTWYDGYSLPTSINESIHAYTPWAVMKYLGTAYIDENFTPQNYWTQSGASTILQNLFKKEACVESELSTKLQNLISQNSLLLDFDQHISLFKYGLYDIINNEKIFSYLLLNSGYLTMKREDRKYIFSIPNFEVREEFIDIIGKEIANIKNIKHDGCKKIIDGLTKLKQDLYTLDITKFYIKSKLHYINNVFNFIKSDDTKAMSKLFPEDQKINCSDDYLNFNYFHIAFLFQSLNIIKYLFFKCNNVQELLNSKDKVFGLSVKDYYQLNTFTLFEPIFKDFNINEAFKIPNTAMFYLCHDNAWQITIVTGTAYAIKKISNIIINLSSGVAMLSAGIAIDMFTKHMIKHLREFVGCQNYDEYYSMNLVSTQNFNSLKQFKKYASHDQAYLTMKESCDDHDHNEIQTIKANLYDNKAFYTEEFVLIFLLCELSTNSELYV